MNICDNTARSGSGLLLRILFWVVSAAVVAYAVLLSLSPILANDFWWHLKTGELIFQTRALPLIDPFAYPTPPGDMAREKFLLTSYWLAQLLMYGAYFLGGLKGVIAFRVTVLMIIYAVLSWRMRCLKISPWLQLPLVGFSLISLGELYSADRPQFLSFLCAALLMGMFERIRAGEKPSRLLLPLMALWGNFHGGFVIGDILLAIFAGAAMLQYRGDWRTSRGIALWAAAGIGASLLNPNGFKPFIFTFNLAEDSTVTSFISEFMSTFAAFGAGHYSVVILWGMCAITLAGIVANRKVYWPDIAVWAFISYISIAYLRNVAFYTVAMLPFCGYYLSFLVLKINGGEIAVTCTRVVAATLICLSIWFSAVKLKDRGAPLRIEVGGSFPVLAANFIELANVKGRMFNEYDWGGYLIWRLYPRHKMFIDGRVMRKSVLDDYNVIARAEVEQREGRPAFKALLDSYNIEVIFQQISQQGSLQPLMKQILNDAEWVPVYLGNNAYIFVRNTATNTPVIQKFGIRKLVFVEQMLRIFDSQTRMYPQDYSCYLSKGEMLVYLGRYAEAQEVLLQGERVAPGDKEILRNLQFIRDADKGR